MGEDDSKVEQVTALVKALTALGAVLKGSALPVLFSIMFTQGGAALFMQGHVDEALKSEVAPAKKKTEKLQHDTGLAYEKLAEVVNDRGRILHSKASSAEVRRLRRVILEQRKDLEEAFVMLEALENVVASRHGRGILQRSLDAVERVETKEVFSLPVAEAPVPMLPIKFNAFVDENAEGNHDAIQP